MVVGADQDALLRPQRCLIITVLYRLELQLPGLILVLDKVAPADLHFIIDDIYVAEDGARPAESLSVLTATVNARQHWTITIIADGA